MGNIKDYQDIGRYSELLGASKVRINQLIFDRLLCDLNNALDMAIHKQTEKQHQFIDHATEIVNYLLSNLNYDAELDSIEKSSQLYRYLLSLLVLSKIKPEESQKRLQSCINIVTKVKHGLETVSHE